MEEHSELKVVGNFDFWLPCYKARWYFEPGTYWMSKSYPNWWFRIWQRLILGIKWEKVKEG